MERFKRLLVVICDAIRTGGLSLRVPEKRESSEDEEAGSGAL